MAQKAERSEASSPNSLGPERDWPEVRGEECRPRTVLSWLLAKLVVGESEEAGRRTLSSHGPENPEENKFALSLRRWVPLALGPAAEQKQNETEDSPPGPPPGEGAALFSPSPEKEQTPTSPGCPRQGRFVDFLDDLGPGWDAGGAALLREARRTGLCVDSAWGGAALEDAGGRPRRRADRGLAVKGAIHELVSSSCTSGKKGTGAGRGCELRPAPRNQSSSREGSGLGGLLTSSPMLTAARASMAVSSGSGAAVATTPEGGSPTAPSSSEDVNPSPDAAIDILSTDGAPNEMLGAPWDRPAKSPGNRTGCSLREE